MYRLLALIARAMLRPDLCPRAHFWTNCVKRPVVWSASFSYILFQNNLLIMKKKIGLALLGIFLVIQLFQPARSVPAVNPGMHLDQVVTVPASVKNILQNACYDCHSYQTKYPWYARVAPVSWWLASHVREGREHLNFSTFGSLAPEKRAEASEEMTEVLQKEAMPLKSYTWTHPEARLDAAQREELLNWLGGLPGDRPPKPEPESNIDED